MATSARAVKSTAIRDGVDVLAAQAEEFASGLAGPPWLTRLRRDGLGAFAKAGFPSLHDEDWRYTNLLPLARTAFGLAPRDVTIAERTQSVEMEARLGTLGLSSPGPRLVFVNGRLVRRTAHTLPPEILFENLATVLRLAPERVERALVAAPSAHPFVALNAAFLGTGALVRVGKGLTAPTPLVVVHLSTSASGAPAPLMSHLRNLVVLEENAAATVVEVFLGADEPSFTNAVTQAILGENARLTHIKVQLEGRQTHPRRATSSSRTRRAPGRPRTCTRSAGRRCATRSRPCCRGEGCGTELYGLFAAAAGQNVDCHTLIDHAAPHADSLELYKGILDGNGTRRVRRQGHRARRRREDRRPPDEPEPHPLGRGARRQQAPARDPQQRRPVHARLDDGPHRLRRPLLPPLARPLGRARHALSSRTPSAARSSRRWPRRT